MKALSLKPWWAWAVVNAGKRIENRNRVDGKMPPLCSYRGPLLIHASTGGTREEFMNASSFMCDAGLVNRPGSGIEPEMPMTWKSHRLHRGGIVGVCNVVAHIDPMGVVHGNAGGPIDRRWHLGERANLPGHFGLVLADVRPLPFTSIKGALGLFEVPDALVPAAARTA